MKRHVFQCPLYSGQTPDLAVAELTAMKMLLFPRLDPSFFALFAANSLTCMAEFSISCVFCLRRSFLMDCCCGFVNDSGWSRNEGLIDYIACVRIELLQPVLSK